MRIRDIRDVGRDYDYKWPDGMVERYYHWIEWTAVAPDGEHVLRIGKAIRPVYGKERARVTVWIDGQPHAEFLGADDFESSGEILCELKVHGDVGERIVRYPDEPIPERYAGFRVVGLRTRVSGPGVHEAWAVVCGIADHESLAALGGLRRLERMK